MKRENFTLNLSHTSSKMIVLAFIMLTSLWSQQASAQMCPLACNQNVQVSLNDMCEAVITPDMMLEGQGTDPACDYVVVVLEDNNQPIPQPIGSDYIGRTLKVRVELGQNSCWGRIFVEDKLPPQLDCDDDIVVSCYSDSTLITPPFIDNCGTVTIDTIFNEIDDSNCAGDTTAIRTLRLVGVDEYGNRSRVCERRIFYTRTPLDSIVFPQDTVLACDSNPNDSVNPSWDTNGDGYPQPEESGVPTTPDGHPVFPNNSLCELNATFTDQELPQCGNTFKVLRNWVVMDWCTGLILNDFQIIKIEDKAKPIVTCFIDTLVVNADPYQCNADVDLPNPVTIFDCNNTTLSVGYLLADEAGLPPVNGVYIDDNVRPSTKPGHDFRILDVPVGLTWIRYLVTDDCGNVGSCFTEIQVIDNVPPVAVCDEFTVVTLTSNDDIKGEAYVFATTFDDGSHDNCNDVEVDARRMERRCGANTSIFTDKVKFCCDDLGRETMVEMRVREVLGFTDDHEPIYGLQNTCMVNVTVQDKSNPIIRCPRNTEIECTDDINDISLTGGNATVEGLLCGNATITNMIVSNNINDCGVGNFSRRFTAQIPGRNDLTCTQRITVIDDRPFTVRDIIWDDIRDITLTNECMGVDTDPSVTGRPRFRNADCASFAASYKDKTFTLVDSVCFKILRTWTVIDWCEYDPNNPQNGGFDVRQQIIKLQNDKAPEFEQCKDITVDAFGADCDGFIELTNDADHDCPANDNLRFSYRIDEFNTGRFGRSISGKDASGTYPVGTHRILWEVEDMCGNVNTCEHLFTLEDKKKPTPYCLAEITTVVMPSSKMIEIWANDFDRGSYDNCDGTDVEFSFSTRITDKSEKFDCSDLGINMLEIWVTDSEGNQDFCRVRINIQSNDGSCDGSRLGGFVKTEDMDEVDNVDITMKALNANETFKTKVSTDGSYSFDNMPAGDDYELGASRNDDYMNGVSTLDLVLIQRHILGLNSFDSPYKVIASDVNNSESVSAADLVDLRKLILGIYTELPNNSSWRFVDRAYNIPEVKNPWPFNELMNFNYSGQDIMDKDFVAVKIGDVNGSAKANLRSNASDNRSNNTLELITENIDYAAEDIIRVPVQVKNSADIYGLQMAIGFNASNLEFLGFESRNIELSEEHIGLANVDDGVVKISWTEHDLTSLDEEDVLFDVVMKANTNSTLVNDLYITADGMMPEAYDAGFEVMDISLDIRSQVESGFELFQNTPNPFDNSTSIRFNLSKDNTVTFKVIDVTGRVIYKTVEQYYKGDNTIQVNADDLEGSGLLYYVIEVGGITSTRKMILIKE